MQKIARRELRITIADLHDPNAPGNDRAFWRTKSYEERLEALEILRRVGMKFLPLANTDENSRRLRRVLRVSEQE